jgi:hypothetical protein
LQGRFFFLSVAVERALRVLRLANLLSGGDALTEPRGVVSACGPESRCRFMSSIKSIARDDVGKRSDVPSHP